MAGETPHPAPGRNVRLRRALTAELVKARRQPVLLLYLFLAALAAGIWGPCQYRIAREQERERIAPVAVTNTFGTAEPAPAPEKIPEGRGANGFLVLTAGARAGIIVAAILILLYAAGLLAGEGTAGTYRLLLTRPISRSDLLVAKAILLLLLALTFVLVVTLVAGSLGFAMGGYGDRVDVRFGQVDYTSGELFVAAAKSLALAILALLAVGGFGLFISSLTLNSASAVTIAALGGIGLLAMNLALSPETATLSFLTHVDRTLSISESLSRGLSEHRLDARMMLPGTVVPLATWLLFLLGRASSSAGGTSTPESSSGTTAGMV